MKQRVAFLFGGKSPEHEVSVITAVQAMHALDGERYEAVPLYIAKDGSWLTGSALLNMETFKDLVAVSSLAQEAYLLPSPTVTSLQPTTRPKLFRKEVFPKIDVFFPCFHGGAGEGGGFQGLLDVAEVPYVGSGVLGSVTGMDKVAMKALFKQAELPMVKYQWFFRSEWEQDATTLLKNIENALQYPLFVKPANAGSSIGVAKVNNHTELRNAIDVAAFYDRKIVIEESFEGAREINVSVLGTTGSSLKASVCEEVGGSDAFLTYSDKYQGGGKQQGMASTKRQVPADLPESTVKKLQDIAMRAFSVLDCSGVARIDFLLREQDQEIRIIEINTIPGSLSFYLWEATGMPFAQLLTELIELAIARREDLARTTTTFSSNILANFSPGLKN